MQVRGFRQRIIDNSLPQVTARAVAKGIVYIALAALLLPVSFNVSRKGTGNGSVPSANQPVAAMVFTVTRMNCPPQGSRRPCVGNSNIWAVNSDGSGLKPLTGISSWGVSCGDPVWSPDGTKIAFSSNRALDGTDTSNTNVIANVWAMNADGSNARPLTKLTQPAGSGGGVWSPSGHELAFVSTGLLDGRPARLKGNGVNIWVMNAGGSGALPLTRIAADDIGAGAVQTGPVVWSPDGRRLAFVSDRALNSSNVQDNKGIPNLWVMNADGSNAKPLTKTTAANTFLRDPAWSPDSRKLAFAWKRGLGPTDVTKPITAWNIWTVNTDGTDLTPLTKLTAEPVSISHPAWSPDGSRLVFDSGRALDGSDAAGPGTNIWVIKADGTDAKPLTKLTAKFTYTSNPAWSPDGNSIAFASARALDGSNTGIANNVNNVWVMKAAGTAATPLTRFTAANTSVGQPRWRP